MKVTIDQALKELSSLCEDKEITILQEIEKKKFVTKYDHGRILQVMINLISNALKFSPKFSTITIECDFITKDNSQYIQVTVRDEGVGIDPRDLDAIFVKFEQGTKTKTKSGGTGLGLAICQDIILLHDGKIWATNNPECGSSFTFTIPFYDKSNASNTS